jgi:hypothetical protein
MRLNARRISGEAGGAMVEFALMSLILIPTMLYAMYFYELTFAKLKLNEASRYMVWEMTAYGLSNWRHPGGQALHDARFADAKKAITQEVIDRYADDLDGATPGLVANYKAHKPLTIEVSIATDQIDLQSVDPGVFTVAGFSGANALFDDYFDLSKFNKNGKVTGTVKMHIKNVWLKRPTMLLGYKENMLMADEMDIKCGQSLIADQWDLKDGTKVAGLEDKSNCDGDGKNGYCQQVANMHLYGITNWLGTAMNGLDSVFSAIGIHDPFSASVKSFPLSGPAEDSKDQLDIGQPPHASTPTGYHTNVYKDTWDHNKSRYFKVYDKLGGCYMGCPDTLKQEGSCNYGSGKYLHKSDCSK